MKILIAADMEGITGVTCWEQVDPDHKEYARFRVLMTQDVNAAVHGAFAAGADEVVVADGHHFGRNIILEDLHPDARLNAGNSSPLAMVQGAQYGIAAAMFIGYHARAGTRNAVLDHTWSSSRVINVWLNGKLVGETGLNAAVCGFYGAPVLLVSGDQSLCAEAGDLLPYPLETVTVKHASGRTSAECLPPQVTQAMIREAALRAVTRFKEGRGPLPFQPAAPVEIAIELATSDQADRASLVPGLQRVDGRRVELTAPDMPSAYRAFRAALVIG